MPIQTVPVMAGEESIVYKYVRLLFTNIWPRNQTYTVASASARLWNHLHVYVQYYIRLFGAGFYTYVQLYIVDQKICNFLQNLKLSTPHIN